MAIVRTITDVSPMISGSIDLLGRAAPAAAAAAAGAWMGTGGGGGAEIGLRMRVNSLGAGLPNIDAPSGFWDAV